jgi:hypothetical protein
MFSRYNLCSIFGIYSNSCFVCLMDKYLTIYENNEKNISDEICLTFRYVRDRQLFFDLIKKLLIQLDVRLVQERSKHLYLDKMKELINYRKEIFGLLVNGNPFLSQTSTPLTSTPTIVNFSILNKQKILILFMR